MTVTSEPTTRGGAPGGPARAFDPHVVRRDFPILSTTVHGKPLIYLDSASTSQKIGRAHV